MTSPFKGALQRAMIGRSGPKAPIGRTPPKAMSNLKGRAFRGRNVAPIKASPVAEADAVLSQTGEGLRKTIGRIAGRRYKEGGKVGAAMSALQQLAKQYKAALEMDDTEAAARIKRQMERMKRGSSKEADAEAKKIGGEKAATFAEGGKVGNIKKALHAFKIGDKVRVGNHTGKIVGFEFGDDIATVDIGAAIDDGMNDGFAEVSVRRLTKVDK